jgi:hypothetical protein
MGNKRAMACAYVVPSPVQQPDDDIQDGLRRVARTRSGPVHALLAQAFGYVPAHVAAPHLLPDVLQHVMRLGWRNLQMGWAARPAVITTQWAALLVHMYAVPGDSGAFGVRVIVPGGGARTRNDSTLAVLVRDVNDAACVVSGMAETAEVSGALGNLDALNKLAFGPPVARRDRNTQCRAVKVVLVNPTDGAPLVMLPALATVLRTLLPRDTPLYHACTDEDLLVGWTEPPTRVLEALEEGKSAAAVERALLSWNPRADEPFDEFASNAVFEYAAVPDGFKRAPLAAMPVRVYDVTVPRAAHGGPFEPPPLDGLLLQQLRALWDQVGAQIPPERNPFSRYIGDIAAARPDIRAALAMVRALDGADSGVLNKHGGVLYKHALLTGARDADTVALALVAHGFRYAMDTDGHTATPAQSLNGGQPVPGGSAAFLAARTASEAQRALAAFNAPTNTHGERYRLMVGAPRVLGELVDVRYLHALPAVSDAEARAAAQRCVAPQQVTVVLYRPSTAAHTIVFPGVETIALDAGTGASSIIDAPVQVRPPAPHELGLTDGSIAELVLRSARAVAQQVRDMTPQEREQLAALVRDPATAAKSAPPAPVRTAALDLFDAV